MSSFEAILLFTFLVFSVAFANFIGRIASYMIDEIGKIASKKA